jgi:hypothetical protein
VGFEVLTTVVMKSSVFWDITSCVPLNVNWCFGEHIASIFTVERITRAKYQQVTSRTQWTTRDYVPEDSSIAVNMSGCAVSKGRMIHEWWTVNVLEGSGCSLISELRRNTKLLAEFQTHFLCECRLHDGAVSSYATERRIVSDYWRVMNWKGYGRKQSWMNWAKPAGDPIEILQLY